MSLMKYSSPYSLHKERIKLLKKAGVFFSVLIGAASTFFLLNLYSPTPSIRTGPRQEDVNQRALLIQNQEDVNQSDLLIQNQDYDADADDNKDCNLFEGRWIQELREPLYTNMSCGTIPDSKNCGKYGRKDKDFMYWRWKPDDCELTRFDANSFLRMVQGKSLGFVGDSVARNQMESLLCLLSQVETPIDVYKDAEDRFRTWYFPSHDFTLRSLWTKFLVVGTQRVINSSDSSVFDIHVDKIDTGWAEKLPEIDFAIISDGHWFFRKMYLHERDNVIGCVFCDDADVPNLSLGFAFKKAFETALKLVNGCNEYRGLITILRTFSPAHFEHGTWNDGGRCNRTMPLSEGEVNLGGTEWEIRNIQVEEVERANKMSGGKKRFEILDVTRAMLMRADGHPGTHWNNNWMDGYNDCVHWCLPGPIDAWNDLLLAVLKKDSALLY